MLVRVTLAGDTAVAFKRESSDTNCDNRIFRRSQFTRDFLKTASGERCGVLVLANDFIEFISGDSEVLSTAGDIMSGEAFSFVAEAKAEAFILSVLGPLYTIAALATIFASYILAICLAKFDGDSGEEILLRGLGDCRGDTALGWDGGGLAGPSHGGDNEDEGLVSTDTETDVLV